MIVGHIDAGGPNYSDGIIAAVSKGIVRDVPPGYQFGQQTLFRDVRNAVVVKYDIYDIMEHRSIFRIIYIIVLKRVLPVCEGVDPRIVHDGDIVPDNAVRFGIVYIDPRIGLGYVICEEDVDVRTSRDVDPQGGSGDHVSCDVVGGR